MKVAVFGASGFVGTALVERLLNESGVETVAFIRRVGNAWRLSRAQIPTKVVDIRSPSEVAEALNGVTHVVNCTRGASDVMLAGLKNLLDASKSQKVQRFVHLSSISVYGSPPPPESEREDAPANPAAGTYGWEKLKQDTMVASATAAGLDCVVLCPPNISGVYSSFVNNVLTDIRKGTFALVDGGTRPNNTIDVDNLVHAIMLSLKIRKGDGKRIFVSDGEGFTWKDLSDALLPLAEHNEPVPNVPADEVTPAPIQTAPAGSLWKSVKHLVSSDVREAVRRDPRWAKVDTNLRQLVARSGARMEDRLRHSIEGPQKVSKVADPSPFVSRYTEIQTRTIWHRIDRARDVLGYEPQFTFAESMERYRDWYRVMYGFGQPYWPLVRTMEAF